jgi:hypothetical protein
MSPIQFPRGLFLQPMPERRHHHPRRPRINMWHTLRPDRRRDTLFLGRTREGDCEAASSYCMCRGQCGIFRDTTCRSRGEWDDRSRGRRSGQLDTF